MAKKQRNHLDLVCDISELAALLIGSENIETFLQRTVEMVARHLSADVCSIYLYDEDAGDLVLRSTLGLSPRAVNRIRMRPGEGLVGSTLEAMAPILEGSASGNPRFRYFEEAEEDRFESFLAVPILRGEEKIGVLVVQHEEKNYFDAMDTMALRASASQLAGAVGNARLLMAMDRSDAAVATDPNLGTREPLHAVPVSPGSVYGPATVRGRRRGRLLTGDFDTDPPMQREDFDAALAAATEQLTGLQERVSERLPESASLIFSAHFMILKDKRFTGEIYRLIESGMRPREAVRSVARKYITIFSESPHTYIREKVNDIEDVASRLLENMDRRRSSESDPVRGRVVFARELYPSDVLKLASEEASGIVLVSGGATSHVAIISRSMRIPVVISHQRDLLKLPEGTPVLVDADDGRIHISPDETVVQACEKRRETRRAGRPAFKHLGTHVRTRDDHPIRLLANINLLSELTAARQLGVEGIGLYRTEFPFLIRSEFPSEEEQFLLYRQLFETIPKGPITVRTLDAGGEKMLAYSDAGSEGNPELGLRSIRFSLRYRQVFTQQLRAILRAAGTSGRLRLMFPMISSLDEFIEARDTARQCQRDLADEGLTPVVPFEIGAMIELPATLAIMEDLAREADFFSIGTNDFIQFMLAADRSNELVADYYEPAHPAVLRGLAQVTRAAAARGTDVSVCGEMAHESDFIPFLLGIGTQTLSVDPQFLPQVHQCIAQTDLSSAKGFAAELLALPTIREIRERIAKGC